MRNLRHAVVVCVLTMSFAALAHAIPVTYCLAGVVFDDGGTASGCFSYDAGTNSFANINIVTTTGASVTGSTYSFLSTSAFTPGPGGALFIPIAQPPFFPNPGLNGTQGLGLFFTPNLGLSGSIDLSVGSTEATCGDNGCTTPNFNLPVRFITAGFAFEIIESAYQIRYLANLDKGDSYINLSNSGTLNGFDPAGRICVNVYTFDPAEELISCCACPVTPNGLNSLSARNDLISNTLTPGVPTSVTVKLLSTVPSQGGTCDPSLLTAPALVRGMRAWATTLHLNTSGSPAVGYQTTETPFSVAELSASELSKLSSFCGFIRANGSGFGICKSCRSGALGAGQQQ